MFDGIEAFGRQFLSAIFILVCTLLGARLAFGWKSELTRHAAIIAVLCLLVGLQYYFLLDVVTYVPSTRFFTYDSSLVRLDCKNSGKGGKRIDGSTKSYDINPCYCQSSVANCVNSVSGAHVVGDCPIDSNHYCSYFNNGTEIDPYIASDRNCRGGQGTKCTKEEPCYPCEISSVMLFGSDRCRTCSTDFSGNCNFVPDVGPYCYVKPGSKKIAPCKTCCTEPSPVIVNGTCY